MSTLAVATTPEATPVPPASTAPATPPAGEVTPAAASAPASGTAPAAPAEVPAVAAPIEEPPLQPSGVRVVADSEWGKFKDAALKKAEAAAEKKAEAAQVEAKKRWKELGFVDETSAYNYLAFMRTQAPGAVAPAATPAAPAAAAPPVEAAPVAAPIQTAAPVVSDPDLAAARAEAAEAKLELEAVKAGASPDYSDWAVGRLKKHLATLPQDQAKTFKPSEFFAGLKATHPTAFGVTPPAPVREVPATTTPGGTPPPATSPSAVTQAVTRVDFSKLPPAERQKYLLELEQAGAASSRRPPQARPTQ